MSITRRRFLAVAAGVVAGTAIAPEVCQLDRSPEVLDEFVMQNSWGHGWAESVKKAIAKCDILWDNGGHNPNGRYLFHVKFLGDPNDRWTPRDYTPCLWQDQKPGEYYSTFDVFDNAGNESMDIGRFERWGDETKYGAVYNDFVEPFEVSIQGGGIACLNQ